MTIILELAAPGSHQWRVLGSGSAPLWVLRAFIDVSDCTLHGLFVHHLAQRSSVCIPASQRRRDPLSPSGFWVHSQVPLGFGVLLSPWAPVALEQGSSQITFLQDMMHVPLAKHTLQRKTAFPRLHQLHKPVGAAGITVTHVSRFVCKLWVASPFSGGESSGWEAGKPGFVPTLALQCRPSCSGVCPPGERQTPAFTKATVLGGIRDCCYNTSTFSGHESVCKVQFLTISTFFFSESKKSSQA